MRKTILVLFVLFAMNYALVAEPLFQVEQCFITNPYQSDNTIEFFICKPEGKGNGSFPVMFLLHGHQEPESSIGGKQLVDYHYLDHFVAEGIVAVSISTPGFGQSDGVRDFAGPESQKAVAAVIEYCASLSYVDAERMGIYGISKGAILASVVPVYYPDLSLLILEGGEYDLTNRRTLLPDYLNDLREGLVKEVGSEDSAYIARSAIYNTQSIQGKTLLLHGEFDDRRGLPSAIALQAVLLQEGKECLLKMYPNECHCLPTEKWEAIIPFVRQQFFNISGIGIKLTNWATPAAQICKIRPDSPASKSGKLKIGDAILKISPHNDANEIEVMNVPIKKITACLLGEKGSTVRLHVQHFDLTYDDVVLERG